MNIGILTFHMAHNFGAMLQAYALSYTVNQMADCSCEIIDYRLPEIYEKYNNMLKKSHVMPKHLKFEDFMNKDLPLSNRLEDPQMANQYSAYILGSDQIWNPDITKGYKDVYFGMLFPIHAYCVSYAASTGFDVGDWRTLAKKVSRIDRISVRETWCKTKLADNIEKKIECCLDPVLLLQKKEWDKLIFSPIYKKYSLVYAFDIFEDEYQGIENYAKIYGNQIIEIVTHKRKYRENIVYDSNCGPKEFIGYIKYADIIYTDSYHGVLFSIIYEKKFVYFSRNKKKDSRVKDILEKLHIKKDMEGCFIVREKNKKLLERYKKNSLSFLMSAILRRG